MKTGDRDNKGEALGEAQQKRTMMGMGGRYLDTRLTVRPDCTITMISPALIFSAVLHTGVGCATEGLVVPRSSFTTHRGWLCIHEGNVGQALFSISRGNTGSGFVAPQRWLLCAQHACSCTSAASKDRRSAGRTAWRTTPGSPAWSCMVRG